MFKKLTIGLGSAIVIAAIVICAVPLKTVSYEVSVPYLDVETYYVSEPYEVQEAYETQEPYTVMERYTTTQSGEQMLFASYTFLVKAGSYQTITKYIDINDKTQNDISGTVRETAGYDIDFYVFDEKNHNAWRHGLSYTTYVYLPRLKYSNFYFVPDHSGYYYFVFDNAYSPFTDKLPRISAIHTWEGSITEYREVTRYRTVTEYRTVTKYRYVEQQRVVTKERQETRYKKVTSLDYLLHY